MTRHPSGITGPLPDYPTVALGARVAQVMLAVDEQPIGTSAPCMNPECARPVDYVGSGPLVLYCSHTCRSRAATIRTHARQQLKVIEQLLEETRYRRDVPRDRLRARVRQLHWWLARLGTYRERSIACEQAPA